MDSDTDVPSETEYDSNSNTGQADSTWDKFDIDDPSETENDSNSDTDVADSMWDKIQLLTYADNKDFWYQLLTQDKTQFKLKFKEAYLEHCKTWLNSIHAFVEEDETWASLMDTKSKIYETVEGNEDEALFSAVDARRYKLFKLIDWDRLEVDIYDNTDENDSEDGEVEEM